MPEPRSDGRGAHEPLVVQLGGEVYRRIGSVWVDRRFVAVSTMLASRLDELVYRQMLAAGQEPPEAGAPSRSGPA